MRLGPVAMPAAPAVDGARDVPGDRAGVDSAETRRAHQDQSARRAETGGAAARGVAHRSPAADARGVKRCAICAARVMMLPRRSAAGAPSVGEAPAASRAPLPGTALDARASPVARQPDVDTRRRTRRGRGLCAGPWIMARRVSASSTRARRRSPRRIRIAQPVAWLRCFRGIDTLTAILSWPSCTTSVAFVAAGVDGVSRARPR